LQLLDECFLLLHKQLHLPLDLAGLRLLPPDCCFQQLVLHLQLSSLCSNLLQLVLQLHVLCDRILHHLFKSCLVSAPLLLGAVVQVHCFPGLSQFLLQLRQLLLQLPVLSNQLIVCGLGLCKLVLQPSLILLKCPVHPYLGLLTRFSHRVKLLLQSLHNLCLRCGELALHFQKTLQGCHLFRQLHTGLAVESLRGFGQRDEHRLSARRAGIDGPLGLLFLGLPLLLQLLPLQELLLILDIEGDRIQGLLNDDGVMCVCGPDGILMQPNVTVTVQRPLSLQHEEGFLSHGRPYGPRLPVQDPPQEGRLIRDAVLHSESLDKMVPLCIPHAH